jgi:hypothetical protein
VFSTLNEPLMVDEEHISAAVDENRDEFRTGAPSGAMEGLDVSMEGIDLTEFPQNGLTTHQTLYTDHKV